MSFWFCALKDTNTKFQPQQQYLGPNQIAALAMGYRMGILQLFQHMLLVLEYLFGK